MNDIICLFADGSLLISIYDDQLNCVLRLQPALDSFLESARHWKISINPKKTKVMTFEHSISNQINLVMNTDLVPIVKFHCHLGMLIQDDLKWGQQVDSMIQKAKERLKILKYYKHNFNALILNTMYRSYIRPKSEYYSPVWYSIILHII